MPIIGEYPELIESFSVNFYGDFYSPSNIKYSSNEVYYQVIIPSYSLSGSIHQSLSGSYNFDLHNDDLLGPEGIYDNNLLIKVIAWNDDGYKTSEIVLDGNYSFNNDITLSILELDMYYTNGFGYNTVVNFTPIINGNTSGIIDKKYYLNGELIYYGEGFSSYIFNLGGPWTLKQEIIWKNIDNSETIYSKEYLVYGKCVSRFNKIELESGIRYYSSSFSPSIISEYLWVMYLNDIEIARLNTGSDLFYYNWPEDGNYRLVLQIKDLNGLSDVYYEDYIGMEANTGSSSNNILPIFGGGGAPSLQLPTINFSLREDDEDEIKISLVLENDK